MMARPDFVFTSKYVKEYYNPASSNIPISGLVWARGFSLFI